MTEADAWRLCPRHEMVPLAKPAHLPVVIKPTRAQVGPGVSTSMRVAWQSGASVDIDLGRCIHCGVKGEITPLPKS